MGRVPASRGRVFRACGGALAWGLALLSALACGGLADHRREGEPMGMLAMGGGSAEPSGGECNPFIGNGCEMPIGCAAISSRCQPPTASRTPDAPVPREPPPPEAPPEPELLSDSAPPNIPSEAAENVLEANCGACHGPSAVSAGGLGIIQDFEALRQAGYIVDCSPESSRIVQVMRSGSMPPSSSGLPVVTAPDIEVVVFAIEVGCPSPEVLCAGDPALPGCGAVLAEQALERNCGACHGAAARQSGTFNGIRYIDNMPLLIENAQVLPCQSQASPLLLRARDGSMPPLGAGLGSALSPRDDSMVAAFIDGLCPGPAAPEDSERLRAEELLGTYCGDCHGQRAVELGQVQGNIDDIESVDALIRAGLVLPCAPERSRIIQVLREGTMPPPELVAPRPVPAEIERIAYVVNRPCVGP